MKWQNTLTFYLSIFLRWTLNIFLIMRSFPMDYLHIKFSRKTLYILRGNYLYQDRRFWLNRSAWYKRYFLQNLMYACIMWLFLREKIKKRKLAASIQIQQKKIKSCIEGTHILSRLSVHTSVRAQMIKQIPLCAPQPWLSWVECNLWKRSTGKCLWWCQNSLALLKHCCCQSCFYFLTWKVNLSCLSWAFRIFLKTKWVRLFMWKINTVTLSALVVTECWHQ